MGRKTSNQKTPTIFPLFSAKISNLTDDVVVNADGGNCGLVIIIKPNESVRQTQSIQPLLRLATILLIVFF